MSTFWVSSFLNPIYEKTHNMSEYFGIWYVQEFATRDEPIGPHLFEGEGAKGNVISYRIAGVLTDQDYILRGKSILVSENYQEDIRALKRDVSLRGYLAFNRIDWDLRDE